MTFNAQAIREDFLIFSRTVREKPVVYLDSAATSQKPLAVLDAMNQFYANYNANPHRGVYRFSEEATEAYEGARRSIAGFIGAVDARQIIYTRGTTESINLVMRGWGEKFIRKGDKIVISVLEHHSNFVPWQQLAKKIGAQLVVLGIDNNGQVPAQELAKIKGAKLVAVSHVSNVLGSIQPIAQICQRARETGAVSVVDAAQSVPHMKTSVQKLGCDFLAFSGHKMLGPTGIGVLYGRAELLEQMDPFLFGGEMIRSVRIQETEWNDLPYKFEAGTMPVAEAIGLGAAIGYLNRVGLDQIEKHEQMLTRYALEKLTSISGITVYGPKPKDLRTGVIAFNLDGVHSHDLATVLDEQNVAIRSGHHCAMPLHERLGLSATARISFYLYNTKEEIDQLVEGLQLARTVFKPIWGHHQGASQTAPLRGSPPGNPKNPLRSGNVQ